MIDERLENIKTGIETTKSTLAQNLRGVGVAASDTETLTQLATKVAEADEWHPNPYWSSLDDISDGQIGFIVRDRDSVGAAGRFAFVVTSTANYTIDWGDGVTETLASGAIADHTYAIGGGVSDGRGATTYKVRISSTGNITAFQSLPYKNTFIAVNNPVLYCRYLASETTTLNSAFSSCKYLQSVIFSSLNKCSSINYVFFMTLELESIIFPPLPLCTTTSYAFYMSAVKTITFSSLPICNTIGVMCGNCYRLRSVILPEIPECISLQSAFIGCFLLKDISFISLSKASSINAFLSSCYNLFQISIPENLGAQAAAVDGTNAFDRVPAVSDAYFPSAKFSKFTAIGTVGANRVGLKSLTFHPSSTFSGPTPQIDISYCDFTRQSLVNLFNILPTLTGKQVKITGCTGAAELTAGDRAIATGKGWTIVE